MNSNMGYMEIRDMVLDRIKSKQWRLGQLLPSEIDLAEELGCARATVNKAMALLADEGVIERKRKAGSRVCPFPKKISKVELKPPRQVVESSGARYRYEQITRTFGEPPEWLVEKGMMQASEQALFIESLHYANDKPFQHEEIWINASHLPHAVDQDFSVIVPGDWLYMEVPFYKGHYQLMAKPLDETIACYLALKAGVPILQQVFQLSHRNDILAIFRITNHPVYQFEGYV